MKTKALISFAVTAKLIFDFVFVYAKSWFSHDVAQLVIGRKRNFIVQKISLASSADIVCFLKFGMGRSEETV